MAENVITVKDISKSFGQLRAVSGLSFEVGGGTCFSCLGPNGAGKTTMMKMIYGKCTRDEDCGGTLDVLGFDPRFDELEIKYRSGVVPQEDNLDEELNVIENLMLYSRFYNIPRKEAKKRISYLLDFLELPGKSASKIRELSGGMKRRLVIARALLNNPQLLILDEPTTGLDPQVRHLIWNKLLQLKEEGTTILLTTHYMEEAFRLSDRVLIMHLGNKIMEGSPVRLLEDNIEKFVLEINRRESLDKIENQEILNSVRINDSNQFTRLFSDDVETLQSIATMLKGGEYHLRQANLEDVFLKATGGALNVRQ